MTQAEADKFVQGTTEAHAAQYAGAIADMFTHYIRGNQNALVAARHRLEKMSTETMGRGEIIGASIVLRRAVRSGAPSRLRADADKLVAFAESPVLPDVSFTEALDEMISRTPVTIRSSAERTAQRIAELYGDRRVVAFAYSAEESVTREARRFIIRAMREGIPEGEAGRRLAMSANEVRDRSRLWTESYSRMVFRTNMNTAITAGRFRQAQDPDIREILPAFRFRALRDNDARHNHRAADGMVLRVDHPAWARLAPPLGYNCRCGIDSVPIHEYTGDSTIPSKAYPDEGFRHGGRPDLFLIS